MRLGASARTTALGRPRTLGIHMSHMQLSQHLCKTPNRPSTISLTRCKPHSIILQDLASLTRAYLLAIFVAVLVTTTLNKGESLFYVAESGESIHGLWKNSGCLSRNAGEPKEARSYLVQVAPETIPITLTTARESKQLGTRGSP
ncbi:hypothetical protein VNO77_19423 [Canavalia gladiata]|uniref:Uncharacterized protein n=1 Tax=Canavalia gladiata TaxID=3824 RepID=A0AAN9LMQ9_CANGL